MACKSYLPTVSPYVHAQSMYDRRFHKKYLWLFRIQLLAYLLHHDASVIMNDIDAMWVQDPYTSIFAKYPDVSIFAQRGAFPGIFKRKWGAAACMGFIYFRATEVWSLI